VLNVQFSVPSGTAPDRWRSRTAIRVLPLPPRCAVCEQQDRQQGLVQGTLHAAALSVPAQPDDQHRLRAKPVSMLATISLQPQPRLDGRRKRVAVQEENATR